MLKENKSLKEFQTKFTKKELLLDKIED